MPRAENRKRPPNLSGGGRSGYSGQTQSRNQKSEDTARTLDKKQSLIERMKQTQAKKNATPEV